MEPREQPTDNDIGPVPVTGGPYVVADVEPLDVDGVRAVGIGSALWLAAFVALLPFYSRLADNGRTWWLWTCMAGAGLGLVGLEYCRRRRAVRVELEDPDSGPVTLS